MSPGCPQGISFSIYFFAFDVFPVFSSLAVFCFSACSASFVFLFFAFFRFFSFFLFNSSFSSVLSAASLPSSFLQQLLLPLPFPPIFPDSPSAASCFARISLSVSTDTSLSLIAGRVTMKVAPSPSVLEIVRLPLCFSTICLQMQVPVRCRR